LVPLPGSIGPAQLVVAHSSAAKNVNSLLMLSVILFLFSVYSFVLEVIASLGSYRLFGLGSYRFA
jgi:hypothetical protein